MQRKHFLKRIFGASIVIIMDGFSTAANAMSNTKQNDLTEFASFGAIHLNNTSLEKATFFWTKIVGMKLRESSGQIAEFGTEYKTLVVVHETAKTPFQKGYSGLYHFAIHAPNEAEFASMIHRLNVNRYPYAPTDHTMSKSIYLDDSDGINVEFTLETPERFKRVITGGGLRMEGADGTIRSASDRLDLHEVLKALKDKDVNRTIAEDTYIGHLHLYANNVEKSNAYYKKIGYNESNYLPQYMFADLGAGGKYTHRMVMNSWHGMNKPLAPSESAGMRHYQIIFKSKDKLTEALNNISDYEKKDDGFWCVDPTGNTIFLTHV
ncbi:VOC family protein [Aurantibacter crassamenti]|uniref:VOC family protein n=1 Tax=Aurantibacter crassamenti TaxID=1837375 RepID=UPI00193A83EB|nr:VOC family protein [Aurantibacter crassamenti]MBM1104568.1 VOC family protein [Aurantibacter crassamenti]